MGLKPLPTKCWIKFLELNGFTFSGRIKGSHHIYTKKGSLRPIPVWVDKKEIPGMHLHTSCRTIGTTLAVVYEWAKENC